jgi:FtsZ-binding cell division protein ZapB
MNDQHFKALAREAFFDLFTDGAASAGERDQLRSENNRLANENAELKDKLTRLVGALVPKAAA